MDREKCLELATVLSVRFQITADMSDQAVRQLVRKELPNGIQALQKASIVAPAPFVEIAFRYVQGHLAAHPLERVLDFLTYQAQAASLPPGDAVDSDDSGKPKYRPPPVARQWRETFRTLPLPPNMTGSLELRHS